MKKKLEFSVQNLYEGDKDSYISLFKMYYVSLCAYSRRYVGRKDIAEEIVSETFFNLWKNRKNLLIHTSIKAYLFHAVANNSLKYLRKMSREEKVEDYFKSTDYENIGFQQISNELPEKGILIQELTDKIKDAVSHLPKQQKIAFELKRFKGKKNREVAEIMGISQKTVEMHLSKAMLFLREQLKDYLYTFIIIFLFHK